MKNTLNSKTVVLFLLVSTLLTLSSSCSGPRRCGKGGKVSMGSIGKNSR